MRYKKRTTGIAALGVVALLISIVRMIHGAYIKAQVSRQFELKKRKITGGDCENDRQDMAEYRLDLLVRLTKALKVLPEEHDREEFEQFIRFIVDGRRDAYFWGTLMHDPFIGLMHGRFLIDRFIQSGEPVRQ